MRTPPRPLSVAAGAPEHRARAGRSLVRSGLVLADSVAAGLAWTLQFAVGSPAGQAPGAFAGAVLVLVAVSGLVGTVAVQEGYRSWLHVGGPENLARVLRATAVSVGVVVLTAALLAVDLSVPGAVLGGCWTLVAVGAARWTLSIWIGRRRRHGELVDRSLLVGSDEAAYRFWRHVTSRPDAGRVVVGYVGAAREHTTDWRLPRLGAAIDAPAVAVAHRLDGIVIIPGAIGADDLGSVVRRAHARGLDVELVGGPALVHPRRLSVSEVAHQAVLFVEPHRVSAVRDAAKRVFDLVVGAALVVVVSPLMLAAAIAVVLDDGRPVFYRQVRVGKDRKTFRLWKFRTMHRGADRHEAQLRHRNERGRGPLFKIADDPRTTRVGRMLRATSIDELPQLFNVLAGSMSLVGPRPALVDQEADFDPELRTRSRVKPGMTGLWQVEARDNPDFHAYRQLDLFYAENWSFALDIAVLTWTLPELIRHGLTVRRQRAAAATTAGLAADPAAARDERATHESSATDDDVLATMLPVEHTTFAGFGPR